MDEPKEWDWLTVFGVVAAVAIAMSVAPGLEPEKDVERGRWQRLRAYARSIEVRDRVEARRL